MKICTNSNCRNDIDAFCHTAENSLCQMMAQIQFQPKCYALIPLNVKYAIYKCVICHHLQWIFIILWFHWATNFNVRKGWGQQKANISKSIVHLPITSFSSCFVKKSETITMFREALSVYDIIYFSLCSSTLTTTPERKPLQRRWSSQPMDAPLKVKNNQCV